MDPITHGLLSTLLLRLAAEREGCAALRPGWLLATILVGEAPDLDCITYLMDPALYLAHHRGVTHSLPGALVACVILVWLRRRLFPGAEHALLDRVWPVVWLSHPLLDLMTAYGTGLWEPLTSTRYTLAWLFIFDAILFALLIFALLIGTRFRAAVAALAGLYIGGQACLTARADRLVAGIEPGARSFPMFLDPIKRLAPFRAGSRAGELIVDPLAGSLLARRDLTVEPEAAAREAEVLATWPGTAYAAWSSHPFPIWSPSRQRLEISDLRFQPLTGRRVFVLRADYSGPTPTVTIFHHVPAGEALLPPPPLARWTGVFP